MKPSYLNKTAIVASMLTMLMTVAMGDTVQNYYTAPPANHAQGAEENLRAGVTNNDIEKVKAAIKAGVNVNAVEMRDWQNMKSTPLIIATEKGYEEIVKALIAAGADVNAKNEYGRTALFQAACKKDRVKIAYLLVKAGADVNTVNGGRSALSMAASYSHIGVMKALVMGKVDIDKPDDGLTPLFYAIRDNREKSVRFLLKHGADIKNCKKVMSIAHSVEVANALLKAGADINEDNGAPLTNSIYYGHPELFEFLIKSGAKKTPEILAECLNSAIHSNNPNTVSLVLQYEADVNFANKNTGNTPLMDGVKKGNAKIVKILLEAGADVDAKNKNGETALSLAEKLTKNKEEIIKLLSEAKK